MVKHYFKGAYNAPACQIEEALYEEVLCESSDAVTEDFGEFEDFTW